MRTHPAKTRCRVYSFVVHEKDRPKGFTFSVPYYQRSGVKYDTYVISGYQDREDGVYYRFRLDKRMFVHQAGVLK